MTQNERVNTGSVPTAAGSVPMGTGAGANAAKTASAICLIAGIWLFVSPWVYGAYTTGNAWNSWIVGVLMVIIAATRMSRPAFSAGLSWANMVLGIWTFFSPWIYGYVGNSGRFINSLCVGFVVFVFSIASARAAARRRVLSTTTPRV